MSHKNVGFSGISFDVESENFITSSNIQDSDHLIFESLKLIFCSEQCINILTALDNNNILFFLNEERLRIFWNKINDDQKYYLIDSLSVLLNEKTISLESEVFSTKIYIINKFIKEIFNKIDINDLTYDSFYRKLLLIDKFNLDDTINTLDILKNVKEKKKTELSNFINLILFYKIEDPAIFEFIWNLIIEDNSNLKLNYCKSEKTSRQIYLIERSKDIISFKDDIVTTIVESNNKDLRQTFLRHLSSTISSLSKNNANYLKNTNKTVDQSILDIEKIFDRFLKFKDFETLYQVVTFCSIEKLVFVLPTLDQNDHFDFTIFKKIKGRLDI